jgi:cytochrome P450
MNLWVINQSEQLFGPQCDKFIPERWLPDSGESIKDFEKLRKKMLNSVLSFGAGPRTCIGQHLAVMKVLKTAASFSWHLMYASLLHDVVFTAH